MTKFVKRMFGIDVKNIAVVAICWFVLSVVLINPVSAKKVENVSSKTEVMDISGVWLTSFENVSYNITQKGNQYAWTVRETGETGKGMIEGNDIVSYVEKKKIAYEAVKFSSEGNPVVLATKHQNYLAIVLFRTCDDFIVFLNDLGEELDHERILIHGIKKNLINTTACPEARQSLLNKKK